MLVTSIDFGSATKPNVHWVSTRFLASLPATLEQHISITSLVSIAILVSITILVIVFSTITAIHSLLSNPIVPTLEFDI